jgi:hypothetical protein
MNDRWIEMSYSDDGGHTWSSWQRQSLGEVGEYATRPQWLRLGMFRNRVVRFRISGAVRASVIAVQAQLEPAR